ncbi:MAG: hypothetical protein M3Q29_02560 [Chloroflexota bacterium]|nr:hypothetical protein [Chloroflexota bacterium]
MATKQKQQTTWQQLEQRGGPYTFAELRTLYTRPGMAAIGDTAWCCETCGTVKGTYSSFQLDQYHKARGTFADKPAATPPQEIQDMEARLVHCEQVFRDVAQKLGEAYTELARLTQQERDAEAAASRPARPGELPSVESSTAKAFRRARIQEVNGRIAQLKDAQREALEVRHEASNEYMQRFAEWREQVRQEQERANREAAGLPPEQEPEPNALERFLSGRL